MDCIFCKIINGEIPAEKVYEDDRVLAFKDINPVAPIHIIVIPREHISSILDITEKNQYILKDVFTAVNKIAKDLNIDSEGFRVVNNCGEKGGQTVNHIHFHLLGGRDMQWPPG